MIALIPARGGSKGLPRKNILELNGIPLIAHTIIAALNAKCIDRVVVTTDDMEIAEVARKYGAEVPFMRPDYLARDASMAVDVYIHAFEFFGSECGEIPTHIMVLLPTTPLRNSSDIDNAYDMFISKKARTLIAMKDALIPPSWYCIRDEETAITSLCNFSVGDAVSNRQVNRKYYIPCGAIYILEYNLLKNNRTYYCDNTVSYIISEERAVDIDTRTDFDYAEYLLKKRDK